VHIGVDLKQRLRLEFCGPYCNLCVSGTRQEDVKLPIDL